MSDDTVVLTPSPTLSFSPSPSWLTTRRSSSTQTFTAPELEDVVNDYVEDDDLDKLPLHELIELAYDM